MTDRGEWYLPKYHKKVKSFVTKIVQQIKKESGYYDIKAK
jgi:hypothetical protein